MKLRFYLTTVIIFLIALVAVANAQVDSVIGQFTNSPAESFAGAISGNGRFVVFESRGNLATDNPQNEDGNLEIFLWDYAQRRIFQITNTRSLLFNVNGGTGFSNIRVEISNTRPVISNDGKYIAFSSNATIAYPGDATNPPVISNTNPGNFDANAFSSPTPTPTPTPSPSPSPTATPTPATNSLTNDGNLEMWIYQIPAYTEVADLSAGDEIPLTWLSPFDANGNSTGGTFIRVTNTVPSQLPRAGTQTTGPFIADDNHDASISDDGHVIAFVSTRDLDPTVGNPFPAEDNDEVFVFQHGAATALTQITKTPRGTLANPIYSKNPTISALPSGGYRIAFSSTGDDPVDNPASGTNFDCGSNPENSRNEEIFYADIAASTDPTGCKQITTTTPTNPGEPVNILEVGRRMSRDGRYIAFDSYADLASEHGGANQTSFATYLFDTTLMTGAFRRIGPRSNADSAAIGGDVSRYPGFTDTDANGTPAAMVLAIRLNIKPDGTVATTASEGLNPDPARPVQIYSYQLNVAPANAVFKRLTKFPVSNTFFASTQPIPSNSQKRLTFNLALTELGTGNPDLSSEAFYLIQPDVISQAAVSMNFATGASRIPVSPSPLPTPSPTATPTATPTPTPSPSPTPTSSPTPVPTPTPQTPPAVHGLAPGMLAILNFQSGLEQPIVARTAVGSLKRSFTLPIELSGVSMTINGAACGLKSVSRHSIQFVVPPGLAADAAGTSYPVVVNANGIVLKSSVTIVPARPDIFTFDGVGPGGRAKIFNVTNTVHRTEPFTTFTILIRGGRRVPSRMRLYLTGVRETTAITIRIGPVAGISVTSAPVLVEPGVYTVDFDLPASLTGAGDQPIIVTATVSGTSFTSRLDDTAPRLFIL